VSSAFSLSILAWFSSLIQGNWKIMLCQQWNPKNKVIFVVPLYIHVHAWYVKISPMGLEMSLILILGAACA
jgi:hypothetical protein